MRKITIMDDSVLNINDSDAVVSMTIESSEFGFWDAEHGFLDSEFGFWDLSNEWQGTNEKQRLSKSAYRTQKSECRTSSKV
ncbi:MAG: hypothetical protein FWF88_02625 [Peptococcaceae bacterium]|nr:hypothetical protein [Peptococcaceae bacterium]